MPTLAEGMAADDPPDGKRSAAKQSVGLDGFLGIAATGGSEPASCPRSREQMHRGGDKTSIQDSERADEKPHLRPPARSDFGSSSIRHFLSFRA
jgi:hypothetical protein